MSRKPFCPRGAIPLVRGDGRPRRYFEPVGVGRLTYLNSRIFPDHAGARGRRDDGVELVAPTVAIVPLASAISLRANVRRPTTDPKWFVESAKGRTPACRCKRTGRGT